MDYRKLVAENKGKFYLYHHVDPRNMTLKYIGKGTAERAWDMYSRNIMHDRWIKKLKRLGLKPIIQVVVFFEIESLAYLAEKEEIAKAKESGIKLLNASDGGIGGSSRGKKPIVCVTTGKIYNSTVDASEDLGFLAKRINSVLKGKKKSYKGLSFKYLDESLNEVPFATRESKEKRKKASTSKELFCVETGEKFNSLTAAANKFEVTVSSFSLHLKGNIKKIKGLTFKEAS